jgi:L-alanine-DL-glutamate epimerase-like enolase superfamily enzyme
MYRASIPYGRKGAAIQAISAVDLALWDLRARMRNVPVCRLMNGAPRSTVPVYASHLQPVDMDSFVAEAADYVQQGYRAMKMRMPGTPSMGAEGIRRNVERVKAVRDTVGDGIDLMVDAYMGWDLEFALAMSDALAPFGLRWIEEPLLPDAVSDYAELTKRSPVPIAAGEHEFTHYGFRQLIEQNAVHVLQPDVHRAGGLTAALRICEMAARAGLAVAPHVFSAPTVHLVAAHSTCLMVEKLTVPVWVRETKAAEPLIVGEPEVAHGEVAVSEEPGFGVRINETMLARAALSESVPV